MIEFQASKSIYLSAGIIFDSQIIPGQAICPRSIKKDYMIRKLALAALIICAFSLQAQEVRTFDGIGNNLQNPAWGAAHSHVRWFVTNGYADGMNMPGGMDRPNPRVISNALFAQEGNINDALALSDYVWVFGQFIDHDITLVENMVTEPLMIPVPAGDQVMDPFGTGQVVIPMFRNVYDPSTGTSPDNPRTHMNEISSFIDGSAVYGSDVYRANWLRSFQNGKMKVSQGNLLPFNTVTGEFNDPVDPAAPFMGDDVQPGRKQFVAGDIRANENVLLIAFHTIFVREHNRICDELLSKNPALSDEMLYQQARRMVIGHIQSIVYDEWLPAMGVILDEYKGYDPEADPNIMNVFSAAAFRLGHTLLSPVIRRMDENGETIPLGDIELRDAFFQPLEVLRAGGLDPYFKGMGAQIQQALDCKVIDDVRNFLFGPPGAGGLDLASINIMRGRERGLPDFNTVRADFGLEPVTEFRQICSFEETISVIEDLYGTVDNIDAWVGLLAEDHMPQALFGETIMEIMHVQFQNLRDGDRFFYMIDPGLSDEDIDEIRNTRFSDIIRRNTNIKLMQDNVFFAMEHEDIPFANAIVLPVELDATLFPNPVVDELHIKVYTFETADLNVEILNNAGMVVQEFRTPVKPGENKFTVDIEKPFSPGLYFVHLNMGDDIRNVLRFVVP